MSEANKTLVILTPGFPKDEADSTCLPFLQNFVLELNGQFPLLKLIILAFDYPFTTTSYQWNKNEVLPFNGWKKRDISKLFKWLYIWRAMKKARRSDEIIGILSLWCNECALLGNRFAKRNNLDHYCWIQGQDAKKENHYVKRINPTATELIAISDFIQNEFEKNHSIRPKHMIPIGIRTAEFSTKNMERDIDILGVGSLIPLKQYELFIEVIHNIKKHFPGIKVVLCGKGPEETTLKALVEKYGLQKNITLAGELPHTEILMQMKRSKVFLHTSNYEGLGVVCIEALYAGCNVISFVKPIYSDIEQWHIVQTKEAMTEKAMAILNDPAVQPRSILTFTMEDTAKKIVQLYGYMEASNR
jgi:glycosyltransferase involved in cell wall biosynthesis